MKVINITTKRRAKKSFDITYATTVNFDGAVLPIQNKEEWGSYRPALKSIHTRLKYMLNHHCKIFVLRSDFHIRAMHWEEGDFSKLLKRSNRLISKHYKLKRIAYLWAREASMDGSHHYHLMLILDANKVNNPMVVTNILTEQWIKLGHPHPRRNSHHILSNDIDSNFQDAFHHCSYLAKIHTKDQQPSGARNFGSSQVKLNDSRLNKTG